MTWTVPAFEEISQLLAWWNAKVAEKGRPSKNVSDTETFSVSEAEKNAAAASSPLVRDNFLSLAQTWTRLARELEASKRFMDALGEEFPVEKPSPPRDQVA
jgi:hypothetical protein